MSVFSAKDFDSKSYNDSRPTYPDEFYKLLLAYHNGPRKLAIDVGCGPGTATFHLAHELMSFDKLIGTDLSNTMIETAKQLQIKDNSRNISFKVSSSESFEFLGPSVADKQVCDLICAAECAHWFEFDKFQESAVKNLRFNGTIAIWGYSDALFVDYPDLDCKMIGITYDMDKLGSYWPQPGRNILRGMYRERTLNNRKFGDIQEVALHATHYRSSELKSLHPEPLKIFKRQTILQYANYIKTWSAYHSWKKDHWDDGADIVDSWVQDILEVHPELAHKPQLVAWNTFYQFGRRL